MPLMTPMPMNTIELSMLTWRTAVELAQEQSVVKARRYHDGEQLVFLTDRLKQFLNAEGDDITFCMNVCRVVVEAVEERLLVKGFEAAEPEIRAWTKKLWLDGRLEVISDDVQRDALRDGEAFIIADWDTDRQQVRMIVHPRFTTVEAEGDGFGVQMVYPNNDITQPPLYAVKRWWEFVDLTQLIRQQRATFYYPDRIEKFVYTGAGWIQTTDGENEAWPIPWTDALGRPLGIPVIHFRNKDLRSEAWDAIPLQDAVNKMLVDSLAAADAAGFRIYAAMGFIPTTDGQNYNGENGVDIQPGQMIGTTQLGASLTAIDGIDPGVLLHSVQQLVQFVAMVTSTPVSRFMVSGQIAAEGTLKEQQEPLMAKIRKRQAMFGVAWEDTMAMARRIQNKFSTGVKLNEAVGIETLWEPSQTRSETERQTEWLTKQKLGVPMSQIWREMGYSEEKIVEMLATPEVMNKTFAGYPGMPATKPGGPPKPGDLTTTVNNPQALPANTDPAMQAAAAAAATGSGGGPKALTLPRLARAQINGA